ncbi:Bifunctional protein GlmU [Candidatus Lokiarchaeum ossiferum]|uniref:Bifunctional protein GlmU n=1 Tax=Candidatus Lokiarchaeum ossiferum TaxID=2951803 RepID=A0ABY6HJY3_9ARCH|nr:Bifunctional protein GlmU [Candidatus Lokiarchaeum sp. B-35]
MTKLKAVILAAGEGKRLAPLTDTRPKPIIPIAGKPLLQHTIEALKTQGIEEILLIVGYRKEQVIEYFQEGLQFGVQITYIEQTEFLGTGHAANLAKDFAGSDPFLLIYGDLFMDSAIYHLAIQKFQEDNCDGVITAKQMPDPTKWGILKTDVGGYLEQLIEKPSDDRYGNLANAGVYLFDPSIFESIHETPLSSRGEYELTESIEIHLRKKKKFAVVDISAHFWSDVGHPWQLLDATKHVIEMLPGDPVTKTHSPPAQVINHGGKVEEGVTIHGTVVIGKNTILKSGTYIEGPVILGDNCTIGPNSYLRPYTCLGNGCKVGNGSEIKGSIIMDKTAIPHLSYVGDSIIGENVNMGCGTITANLRLDKMPISMQVKEKRVNTHCKKLGTIIGDNAQLGIQVSIMPGKTIGANAYVGSNTIVTENVPADSIYYMKVQNKIIIKT